jgi:ABC-type nitrate/sulfonate/bicarbonate transport system ATPase subunit
MKKEHITSTNSSVSGLICHYFHPNENQPFFKDITFECIGGEISCILGLSGVGKSTLLRIILGEADGISKVHIRYNVEDSQNTPFDAKINGWIGFLSPESSLIPWKNIKENLLIPSFLNKNIERPKEEEINNMLEMVGLEKSVSKLKPHEASFGMCHRVTLARMLLYNPKFLLLDELFTGLDEVTSDFVAELILDYVRKESVVCILVTHDARQAISISKKLYLLTSARKLLSIDGKSTEEKIRSYLLDDLKTNLRADPT